MNPGKDELTLEEVKTWHNSLINSFREERIVNGFTFNENVYDSDERARANISGACTLALVLVGQGADFPEGFTWRSQDNQNIPMTAADVIQMAVTLGTYVTTCYGVSWYHKANVEALETVEELLEYDITVGWPS